LPETGSQKRAGHYNYFRDFDPSTGRYVQSDPIGLAAGLNTYVYVEGNPLLHSDRHGLAVGAAGWVFIGLGAYGAYKLWDGFSRLKKCEDACPNQCRNIRACGDEERNFLYEANESRCIASCKGSCLFESFLGGPKKGPTGPTPPSNAKDFIR
jgi:RHS repeat-associated protein